MQNINPKVYNEISIKVQTHLIKCLTKYMPYSRVALY